MRRRIEWPWEELVLLRVRVRRLKACCLALMDETLSAEARAAWVAEARKAMEEEER